MSSVPGRGEPAASPGAAGDDAPLHSDQDDAPEPREVTEPPEPRDVTEPPDQGDANERRGPDDAGEWPAEADADDGYDTYHGDDGYEPAEATRGHRGRRIAAVAGLVLLAACVAAGVSAGAVAVLTHGFRQRTTVRYQPNALFGTRAGECIDSGHGNVAVRVLPCARPHDAEVFATFTLAGHTWPGGGTVRQRAAAGCSSRLADYVRPQFAAVLTQVYVYPDRQVWQAGVRTVVCEVRASTGTLTGSVRK